MNVDVHAEPSETAIEIAPYEAQYDSSTTNTPDGTDHGSDSWCDALYGAADVCEITEAPPTLASHGSDTCDACAVAAYVCEITEAPPTLASPTSSTSFAPPMPPAQTTASNDDIMACLLRLHATCDRMLAQQAGVDNSQHRLYEQVRGLDSREQYRRNAAFPPKQWGQPPVPDSAPTHGRNGHARPPRGGGGRGRNNRRTPVNYAYADTEY